MKKQVLLLVCVLLLVVSVVVMAFTFGNKTKVATKRATAGFAVVELFTSEGCSSCPPADAAIEKLLAENNPDVFILSFHVDYWNRLGWQDPFSSVAFSDRQRSYARRFSLNGVYTPQVVVNGASEFVGSDAAKLHAAVNTALQNKIASNINITAKRSGNSVTVTYQAAGALLNIAVVEPEETVEVKRGENGGRTLHHVNIVRALQTVDATANGNFTINLPPALAAAPLQVIAYTQAKEAGIITGAVRQML